MSRSVRLEPAAVAPGQIEQLMVKLEEPSVITGVKLDAPEDFEVVRIIAGRGRADGPFTEQGCSLPISPPNAFVTVLVKNKSAEGEVQICAGELLLEGEGRVAVAAIPPTNPMVVHRAPPQAQAAAVRKTVTYDCDERGWPVGGMNEVWVLMQRGEAERLVAAINGYPISSAERPALLRRFQQALGLVR